MNLPDQAGRTFVVTGANTGIGRTTAIGLARAGATLWLACRSADRTRPVIEEIVRTGGNEPRFVELDLGDLDSVRSCSRVLLSSGSPIHGLINNAGLAVRRGTTTQGFELMFGINHLGHFLLTALLLKRIEESAPSRIVNVSSSAHYRCKRFDWDSLRKPARSLTTIKEYSASKLANVLFTRELARRLHGRKVTAYALNPGFAASEIWRALPRPLPALMKPFMISNEAGAMTSLHCATAPELAGRSGLYYDSCLEREPSKLALDDDLARELWKKSLEWCRLDESATEISPVFAG